MASEVGNYIINVIYQGNCQTALNNMQRTYYNYCMDDTTCTYIAATVLFYWNTSIHARNTFCLKNIYLS